VSRRITSLVAQKGNARRVSVYLDGEYAFGLSAMLLADLSVGQMLATEEIEALKERDLVERAYRRATRFLSYRPRSEQEVVRYLERKDIEEHVREQVLARLRNAHLVDDREFARLWVENRETFRPRGRRALRSELWQKGVAREIVERAVSEVDEEQGAMRVARKALSHYVGLEKKTFYRRLLGYLQRRGFGYGVSYRIVDALWEETSTGSE